MIERTLIGNSKLNMNNFDNFYSSRLTLKRLDKSFQGAYLELLNLIADSPAFFAKQLTGYDLLDEFILEPKEIKDDAKAIASAEKRQKEAKIKTLKSLMIEKASLTKCQAIIRLKKELRQCQNKPAQDEDLCPQHEKLDALPYGRVEFDD